SPILLPAHACGQCRLQPSNSPSGGHVLPSNPGLAASCGTPQCVTVPPDHSRKGPSAHRSVASGWTAARAPPAAMRKLRRPEAWRTPAVPTDQISFSPRQAGLGLQDIELGRISQELFGEATAE